MRDFSAELAIERVQDRRTKTYVQEVYRSYANGNYRSALVGLWSVVVCDMLFKLEDLATMHADATAQKILNDMKAKQTANPKSPEWEAELLDRVDSDTELLELGEALKLRHLQKQRHLAAHPILTSTYELHSPTREDVRASLRAALEGLLTKPAMLSRKIFDAFVEDLEKNQNLLPSDEDLRCYVETKYLGRLTTAVKTALFRSLWKLVFCMEVGAVARCDANRAVNFRALRVIYDRNSGAALQALQQEQAYYSNIKGDNEILELLIVFMSKRPDVWPLLDSSAQVLVTNHIPMSPLARVLGWFVTPDTSVEAHLETLKAESAARSLQLTERAMKAAVHLGQEQGGLGSALSAGIWCYRHSRRYNIADTRFSSLIAPYLDLWEEAHFTEFKDAVEANSQTWGRGRAAVEHSQVKAEFDSRFAGATFPMPVDQNIADTFNVSR